MISKLRNFVVVMTLLAVSAAAQFLGLEWRQTPNSDYYYIETIVEIEVIPLPRGDWIRFTYWDDGWLYYGELMDPWWYNIYDPS